MLLAGKSATANALKRKGGTGGGRAELNEREWGGKCWRSTSEPDPIGPVGYVRCSSFDFEGSSLFQSCKQRCDMQWFRFVKYHADCCANKSLNENSVGDNIPKGRLLFILQVRRCSGMNQGDSSEEMTGNQIIGEPKRTCWYM